MQRTAHNMNFEAFKLMCDEVLNSAVVKERQLSGGIEKVRIETQREQDKYLKALAEVQNLTCDIEMVRKEQRALMEKKAQREDENAKLSEDLEKLKLEDRSVVEALQSAKENVEGGYKTTSHLLSKCMGMTLKKATDKELLGVIVKEGKTSSLQVDLSGKTPAEVAQYLWEEAK